MSNPILFQYAADVLARYPTTIGGIIYAEGVHNGPSSEALRAEYEATQKATIARIGATPLSELPYLAAWRPVFRGFGVDPTKYRNAAESLLRRLTKQGNIPSINALVDIGNLVSIRHGLPIAVLDMNAIQGTLTVHFANGSERYTELGADAMGNPEIGEVVFTDETGLVFARRWCWRQSEPSAAKEATTRILVTLEAHHAAGRDAVTSAIQDFLALLAKYTGGSVQHTILDAQNPSFSISDQA